MPLLDFPQVYLHTSRTFFENTVLYYCEPKGKHTLLPSFLTCCNGTTPFYGASLPAPVGECSILKKIPAGIKKHLDFTQSHYCGLGNHNPLAGVSCCTISQRFPVLSSWNRNTETLGSSLVSETDSVSKFRLKKSPNQSRNRDSDIPSLGIGIES